jgi:redox-sensitive bicupin YhaK (pirin superfamily)
VRVVAGSFDGVSSPLAPAEPFIFLDVQLRRAISLDVPNDHYVLVYVLAGDIVVRVEGGQQKVTNGHAVALYGGSGQAMFNAFQPAHFVILSGAAIRDPILVDGLFIMNDRAQIEAAAARYRAGAMGHLEPAAEDQARQA